MPGDLTPTPRSARKPKGEGHVRRAEILAAAERIFVEHGYEGATIRKIADEVGLSSTALYMHFADKSEMLHEICRGAFESLIASHQKLLVEDQPAEVRLRRMIEAYIEFGFENPNAYRLTYLTRPVEAREGAQTVAQETGFELFRAFVEVVEQAVTAGKMRGDPATIAQTIWACGHGIVSLRITKPYFEWADRDELTRTMLDALFSGLLRP
ncbi:TetR/AcrR family transcriptional regulator [Brevundimonas sp. NPDC090276]|uniref:TetR/AcrR family transcriptional regulator n=1 Tax=Brevundimonas sp. NPDC090276 TaxID=3363956 RepID=UPI00383A5DB2